MADITASGRAPRRRRRSATSRYGHLWFVLPGLLFFAAFMIYPAVSGFALSLTAWRGFGNDFTFVGFANFIEALSTWPLYRAAWHNLIMFIVILIFQHTVGLFIAVQLHARRHQSRAVGPAGRRADPRAGRAGLSRHLSRAADGQHRRGRRDPAGCRGRFRSSGR